jgi:hypothetical protein
MKSRIAIYYVISSYDSGNYSMILKASAVALTSLFTLLSKGMNPTESLHIKEESLSDFTT